jgi:hypothetical protein
MSWVNEEGIHTPSGSKSPIAVCGWLLKNNPTQRKFKGTWARHWFSVEDAALWWFKTPDSIDCGGRIAIKDILSVRKFEGGSLGSHSLIVTTQDRTMLLKADTQSDVQRWIRALTLQIDLVNGGTSQGPWRRRLTDSMSSTGERTSDELSTSSVPSPVPMPATSRLCNAKEEARRTIGVPPVLCRSFFGSGGAPDRVTATPNSIGRFVKVSSASRRDSDPSTDRTRSLSSDTDSESSSFRRREYDRWMDSTPECSPPDTPREVMVPPTRATRSDGTESVNTTASAIGPPACPPLRPGSTCSKGAPPTFAPSLHHMRLGRVLSDGPARPSRDIQKPNHDQTRQFPPQHSPLSSPPPPQKCSSASADSASIEVECPEEEIVSCTALPGASRHFPPPHSVAPLPRMGW